MPARDRRGAEARWVAALKAWGAVVACILARVSLFGCGTSNGLASGLGRQEGRVQAR